MVCRATGSPAPLSQAVARSEPCTSPQNRTQSVSEVVPEELRGIIAKRLAAAGDSESMVC